MDGILVFDGQCGMCTRVVNRMARWNRTGRLRIELPESAWWLDASGAVFAGAHAMNAALSKALGTPLPLWIYRLPGIGALQNVVYRWVAAHRYRFRGATPLCESEPERCA